jgi:hypothetical protein
LVPVAIAGGALGMVFGSMEVNVVAFAKEAGVLPYAGLILMAWSFGSLIAGAAYRRDHLAGVSGSALPSWSDIAGRVAIAITVRGSSDPGGSAADSQRYGNCANSHRIRWGHPVRGRPEPAQRGTRMELDGARRRRGCGAAVVGYVIDRSGAQAGFIAVAIAGLLLAVSAVFVRGPRPSVGPDDDHRHSAGS